MGGYVGERIGTKDAAEGAQRRAQSYYHEKIAKPAAEAGLHAGQQTGLLMDKFNQEMANTADAFSRSDFNLTKYGQKKSSGDGTTSSVGEYSSQKTGAQKASGTKGGDLQDKKKGKKKGLSQLQVRKN